MGDGEDTIITVPAYDAGEAGALVRSHRQMFYGPGDGAGRWLASKVPSSTIVEVHEARPLVEWEWMEATS